MIKIARGTHVPFTSDVVRECLDCLGDREISDGSAYAIAAWYQAPGNAFQHLCSYIPVRYADLADAIRREYAVAAEADKLYLDMLSTWALAQHREAGYPDDEVVREA